MDHEVEYVVYGPLRSGTTMLRLMLDHHPRISNPGEFDYLFDATGWAGGRITIDRHRLFHRLAFRNSGLTVDDSLDDAQLFQSLLAQVTERKPGIQTINLHHRLDAVTRLLPGVRVIKLHRDPRDVARSCLPMGFAATLYHGTSRWIETERAWETVKATLAPEDYLELRFEDLVADPETELTRICAFMGVPYDSAMLDYARSSTYDRPDAKAAFQWKRSMSPRDVALCSCRAQHLIRARGYEVPAGLRAPGPFRRKQLDIYNKVGKWRFDLRRYGPALTFGEKLTRWLGMRAQHGRICDRRNDIHQLYIK